MIAVVAGTSLTTPDTTRSYTVTVGPHDVTSAVQWDSLEFEDQGSSAQGTTGFRINGSLATYPGVRDQQWVEIVDHIAGGNAFRGFIDSRRPLRAPEWNEITVVCSAHDSLLDNVIPLEIRPAGESDNARIGYLWGKYATGFLAADLTYVQQVSASLPAQTFAGVTLRQAIDMIAAQASTSAFFYLDAAGRPHYGTSETNPAPANVTSDAPGAGEIAPMDLDIDFDSKSYIGAVYVRGKTDAGSGWVYSESAKANHGGLVRSTFLDAADCTTAAMRNALGNMYLGRVGAAIARGSFSCKSSDADGWRSGQTVDVASSHFDGLSETYRIARVRTSVLGPSGGRPAAMRRYEVEFGGARGGQGGNTGPVVATGVVGDLLDDQGNVLLGSGSDSTASGFGPAIRRYITSGVYNGDFALAPPFPDSSIVQAWNPLPFWTFTQAGGVGITAMSEEDPASGSGRILTFQMVGNGSAADDSYIEQLVPINASRSQAYAYRVRVAFIGGPTVSSAKVYIHAAFVTNDGSTVTGTEATREQTTTVLGADTVFDLSAAPGTSDGVIGGQVPADAYYIRIRVGYKRDAESTATAETVSVAEVHLITGSSEVMIEDITAPANQPARIIRQSGVTYILGRGTTSAGLIQAPYAQFADSPSIIALNASAITLSGSIGLNPNAGQTVGITGPPVGTPSAAQTLAAATAIIADAYVVRITATAPRTITAAPTIADGANGQLLIIVNVGANAITLQDQGTLANSNLRLSTATFAIGTRDSLTLMYSSDIGDWVEISRTNVI